jgi:hypothetical protein
LLQADPCAARHSAKATDSVGGLVDASRSTTRASCSERGAKRPYSTTKGVDQQGLREAL